MKTAHREALKIKQDEDTKKMPAQKRAARRHNTVLGWMLVVLGCLVSLVACVVMVVSMVVHVPLIVLLLIGIGVAIYGAHILPSTTEGADAFLKDVMESASSFQPGRG